MRLPTICHSFAIEIFTGTPGPGEEQSNDAHNTAEWSAFTSSKAGDVAQGSLKNKAKQHFCHVQQQKQLMGISATARGRNEEHGQRGLKFRLRITWEASDVFLAGYLLHHEQGSVPEHLQQAEGSRKLVHP